MEEAEALGLELDVWSYSTLIKGLCQAERMRDAEDVLLAMKSHGVQPNVVSSSFLPCAALSTGVFLALPGATTNFHDSCWGIRWEPP